MARDAHLTPLRRWSAVGLAGAVTVMSILDGAVGSGSLVDSPLMLLAAAVCGCLLGAWTHHGVAATGVLTVAAALTFGNQRHFAQEYAAVDDLAFFLIVIGAPALLGAALVARVAQVRELAGLSERLVAQRRDDIAAARLNEQHRVELAVHHSLIERMGAIALLAEGAGLKRDPSISARALEEIEGIARAGLDDLRSALGLLRDSGGEPAPDESPPHPAPDESPPHPAPDESAPHPAPDESAQSRVPPRGHPELRPGRTDLLLVVGLGFAMAVESVISSAARGPAWPNAVLAMVVASPLLVRRRRPVLAAIAVLALGAAVSSVLTPLPVMVTAIALLLVTAYAVGAWARGWWRAAGVLVMWLGLLLLSLVSPSGAMDPEGFVPTLVCSTLAIGAGMVSAAWTERAARTRQVLAELEQTRDADVRVAVARQRQVIARDLHDTVAHTLSVVCLNAGAAQDSRALTTRDALPTIVAVSRAGMTELRHGLHMLEPDGSLSVPPLTLLAHRLGIELHLVLPDRLDVTGMTAALLQRVLREAVVNAARHAPGARVDAEITRDAARVRLQVIDGGPRLVSGAVARSPGGAALGAGVGLAGLTDLVHEGGGTLESGRLPRGGFRIMASLPLRTSGPAAAATPTHPAATVPSARTPSAAPARTSS